MSQEQDREFFRNYSIVIGLIAVAMAIFFVIAQIIGGQDEEHTAMRAAQTAETTKPAGQVNVAGETAPEAEPAPAAAASSAEPATVDAGAAAGTTADAGKQTYDGLCFSCHGTGLPMVPQFGDKAAWEPRVAQGMDVLYTHAIGGFTGTSGMPMPARGGNPALTDDQVKAAVDYMVGSAK